MPADQRHQAVVSKNSNKRWDFCGWAWRVPQRIEESHDRVLARKLSIRAGSDLVRQTRGGRAGNGLTNECWVDAPIGLSLGGAIGVPSVASIEQEASRGKQPNR